MHKITAIKVALQNSITLNPVKATTFFKVGKGGYAEHDIFTGVSVPSLRKISKVYSDLSLDEIKILLQSKINEERILALFILTTQYKKSSIDYKEKIYRFYLENLAYVNNWNLVDASAHLILGVHLHNNITLGIDKDILIALAKSNNLWQRRIAIVATWHFIKQNDLIWTFKIAKLLLRDKHDLIHKACGWMLREAGKKDQKRLENFLKRHAGFMPRTMLRYAIEKFSQEMRKYYLMKN